MNKYTITGFKGYKSKKGTIIAESPSKALKEFLIAEKIPFKKIEKLTAKVNKELMSKGIDHIDAIDFIVCNDDNYAPNASGNFRIII